MTYCTDEAVGVKMFVDVSEVYLHRDPVDFRKSINGLSAIVELSMNLPLNSDALFVFCSRSRDKLKILDWDKTGFCLWYKRLERDKFKWLRKHDSNTVSISEEELHLLLRGLNISAMQTHDSIEFNGIY
jgi:transposase